MSIATPDTRLVAELPLTAIGAPKTKARKLFRVTCACDLIFDGDAAALSLETKNGVLQMWTSCLRCGATVTAKPLSINPRNTISEAMVSAEHGLMDVTMVLMDEDGQEVTVTGHMDQVNPEATEVDVHNCTFKLKKPRR